MEKDTISEEYSIKYVSETEKDLVQENFSTCAVGI